jgi:DNA-binding NarL/FixJ family response regulator
MTEPVTVFIVDDHTVVRQGIRAYLETHPTWP